MNIKRIKTLEAEDLCDFCNNGLLVGYQLSGVSGPRSDSDVWVCDRCLAAAKKRAASHLDEKD